MQDQDLLDQLCVFSPACSDGIRGARRPAGQDLLLEYEWKPGLPAPQLAAFWLAALWRFLEDSRHNTDAFEGLAFQAMAERLSAEDFLEGYGPLRARLTLPPPYPIELREAYRTLCGRVTSYVGVTVNGELWAGFFQANVYEPVGSS